MRNRDITAKDVIKLIKAIESITEESTEEVVDLTSGGYKITLIGW